MTDADVTNYSAFLANRPAQDESLLLILKQPEGYIGLYVNRNKTEFIYFTQDGVILTLNLKFTDQFVYLHSNISSTEGDVNIRIGKAWTAIDWSSIIWNSDHSNKIKGHFFQTVAV